MFHREKMVQCGCCGIKAPLNNVKCVKRVSNNTRIDVWYYCLICAPPYDEIHTSSTDGSRFYSHNIEVNEAGDIPVQRIQPKDLEIEYCSSCGCYVHPMFIKIVCVSRKLEGRMEKIEHTQDFCRRCAPKYDSVTIYDDGTKRYYLTEHSIEVTEDGTPIHRGAKPISPEPPEGTDSATLR